jgi:O-methyltransferase involved in polyketide biosynthesis
VIIGSGLDSRAYRLPCLAPVLTLEVDFREVWSLQVACLATYFSRCCQFGSSRC